MIKVSVVILSYNRADDLDETIKKIYESELINTEIEIIVVDNASNDNTVIDIKKNFPSVKLIELEKNVGVKAYNIGFEKAEGKYILILDDDSFPEKHSIQRMSEEFEKDDNIGILAFDVRNYYKYDEISSKEKTDRKIVEREKYLMGFNGAGAGFRKSLYEQIGGYPEEFFLYWNETDLAIRVLEEGYKIVEFPDIISYHKFAPTNRSSERGPFYYTRNLYWIIWKYYPIDKILTKTFSLLFNTIYYSIEQTTIIYLKASISAFLKIGKIQRKKIKKSIIDKLRISSKLAFIIFK